MKDWEDLVLETAERFGGTFPHPETADAIATVHQRAPNSVERAIEEVANDYTKGNINSPWGILRSRVGKITADVQPKATTTNNREKLIARAEQWIRTAGLHYDRQSEITDELFGDRGILRTHDSAEPRILELWDELRPAGELIEAQAIEAGAKWAAENPNYQPSKPFANLRFEPPDDGIPF